MYHKKDFEKGMIEIIACGGDTDTNAFLYGMLSGASNGIDSIPKYFKKHINRELSNKLDNIGISIKADKTSFSFQYVKRLLHNIIILPFIFLEITKRHFVYLFSLKI